MRRCCPAERAAGDVSALPDDVLQLIFARVGGMREKLRLQRVSKRWRDALRAPSSAWGELVLDIATLAGGAHAAVAYDGVVGVDGAERQSRLRAGLGGLIRAIGPSVRRLEARGSEGPYERRSRGAAEILETLMPAVADSLEALYCEPISIAASKAGMLGQLCKLQRLDVAFDGSNKASSADADEVLSFLAHLPELQRLKLDLGFSVQMPAVVLQLTNLTHLSMELLSDIPPGIAALQRLRKLAVTDYHGPHDFPDAVLQLPSLQELHIDWHFEDDGAVMVLPPGMSRLRQLRQLSLTPNCCLDGLQHITALTDLTCLYLDCCKFTALPEPLAALRELRELGLTANAVTHIPAWLTRLARLRALDLSYQTTTSLCIAPEVMRMPSLKKVYLVDVEGVGVSAADLPGVRLLPAFTYPRAFAGWDLVTRFTGNTAAAADKLTAAAELHRFCTAAVEFEFDEGELTDPWAIT